MKKTLIFTAILLMMVFNCSKKTTTNSYYYTYSSTESAIVGIVQPPESKATVTACMALPVASAQIDTNGYYKISGLPAGTYSILVQADGYNDYSTKPYIKLTGEETAVVDTIHLISIHDLILSVSPPDGAKEVRVDEIVRIRFRRQMNRESVDKAFHIEPTTEGELSWQGYRPYELVELWFSPRDGFMINTRYQVTIDTSASDTAGIRLSELYRFSFTTEPLRISSSPRNNDTGVLPYIKIRISFNTDMDMESIISAFKMVDSNLKDVEGSFVWSSHRQIEFQPNSVLASNERYTVTIDTTASDLQGTKLSEPYQFFFTTEPIRISSSPSNNDIWVPPNTRIRIVFNIDMNIKSVTSAFKMVDSKLKDVEGNFVWDNPRRMEFYPRSTLATNERYTVTIDTTASDLQGVKLSEPYQFSFTTQPIIILATLPKDKETWVSPSTMIGIAFNTDMDIESVNSAFKMVDSEAKDVTGEFVWRYLSHMEFHPDSALAANEVYTVSIDTTAKDLHGRNMDYPNSFWFKTRPE